MTRSQKLKQASLKLKNEGEKCSGIPDCFVILCAPLELLQGGQANPAFLAAFSALGCNNLQQYVKGHIEFQNKKSRPLSTIILKLEMLISRLEISGHFQNELQLVWITITIEKSCCTPNFEYNVHQQQYDILANSQEISKANLQYEIRICKNLDTKVTMTMSNM